MEVPENLKEVIGGGRFILFGGPVQEGMGEEGHPHMLILCSENARERLRQSNIWLSDGTFRTAPEPWSQLYVVSAQLGSGAPLML